MSTLWLRAETKSFEKRAPLTPYACAKIIAGGHQIMIESSQLRIFTDNEYAQNGCSIVATGSWVNAPLDAVILGLKELPTADFPLIHQHIYFAHAYNPQRIFHEKQGVNALLNRFKKGHGIHYDLEFLMNANGKRIAAFGKAAGFVGAAIALLLWVHKTQHKIEPFSIPPYFTNQQNLISEIHPLNSIPKCLIIGAHGRCGNGVKQLLGQFNLAADEYGRNETKKKSNLNNIINYDIVFNCTYVNKKIRPFITPKMLERNKKLSIIADISCETSGYNPLPIYHSVTTHDKPTHQININNHGLDILAIDNLPSLLPSESSTDFSAQLLPYLLQLLNFGTGVPWIIAKKIFESRLG